MRESNGRSGARLATALRLPRKGHGWLVILRSRDPWHLLAERGRVVLGATVLAASLASLFAVLGGRNALLFDNLQELLAAGGGAIGLALGSHGQAGRSRRLLVALAVALAGAFFGMLAWDLAPAGGAIAQVGDLLFLAGVCAGAAALLPAIFGGLGRALLLGVATDALILLLAAVTLVGATLRGSLAPTGDHIAAAGAITLVGVAGACLFALITRRIPPAPGGPWVLVSGAVVLGAAWLMWIGDPTASTTVGLSDFLFSAGLLCIAYGGVTWDTRPSRSAAYERVARGLSAGLPVVAILTSLAVTAAVHGPAVVDLVGVSTAAVIVTAVARQAQLYVREAQARAAEQQAGQRLAAEVSERATTLLSLQRLLPAATLEETARQVCREALRLEGIDLAYVRAHTSDGGVVLLAVAGLGDGAAGLGELLQADAGARIRARAAGGPWAWVPGAEDNPADEMLRDQGVRAMVSAPLRWDDAIVGDIGLGTCSAASAPALRERLATVEEFGVVVSALLGPGIAERDRAEALRRTIQAVVDEGAFFPVFQPIVDLATREIVGYEALTRFASGQRPDLCFADAWKVGLGVELELATLASAVERARDLPRGRWLDLNVSPRLFGERGRLRALLYRADRAIVLEITEHETIDDYGAIHDAVRTLGHDLRLAVDDAGAGIANFGHIIELRPDLVKLDISLVRRVNANLGRQALVIAMRHFARTAGCRLVAEGIETEEEAETLRTLGVEFGQGYLLGRPAAAEAWRTQEQPPSPAPRPARSRPAPRSPRSARRVARETAPRAPRVRGSKAEPSPRGD